MTFTNNSARRVVNPHRVDSRSTWVMILACLGLPPSWEWVVKMILCVKVLGTSNEDNSYVVVSFCE